MSLWWIIWVRSSNESRPRFRALWISYQPSWIVKFPDELIFYSRVLWILYKYCKCRRKLFVVVWFHSRRLKFSVICILCITIDMSLRSEKRCVSLSSSVLSITRPHGPFDSIRCRAVKNCKLSFWRIFKRDSDAQRVTIDIRKPYHLSRGSPKVEKNILLTDYLKILISKPLNNIQTAESIVGKVHFHGITPDLPSFLS